MQQHPLQRKSVVRSNGSGSGSGSDGKCIVTTVVCTSYVDRHLVVISQLNKFGTVIHAWSDTKADGGKLYDMVTLLGRRDDPLLNVYARQLIEKIAAHSDKPLILAIALAPEGRDTATFQAVLNDIVSHSGTWAV